MLIKNRINSNINVDQSNFFASKTVRDVLELYMINIIQNISIPKPNYKIVYGTLPHFWKSIHRTLH